MDETAIEAAAEAIRKEIDILLSDYMGDDAITVMDGEVDPVDMLLAQSRLYALDWLRYQWRCGPANEERMILVARAALKAAKESAQ